MARGYRRLSPADEDEMWVAAASRPCGQADSWYFGAVDGDGAGLSGAVWRDPTRSAATVTGSVELG